MAWAPDYVDPDELAAYVRIDDTLDDAQIALAITAASRAVDRATRRQFGRDDVPVTRYYTARFDYSSGRWAVEVDDLMSDDGVEVRLDADDVEVVDYVLGPRNAAADGRPWTRVVVRERSPVQPTGAREDVAVTAMFGWSEVPDTIRQATLLQASRFLQRRDAPFGVAGSPDQGSEVRLLARVDPDVHVMLAPYVRPRLRVG